MIEKIKEEVLKEIEKYKEEADDHYDFWNEHIKYVYNEAIILADKYGADKEIVKLGALLHDIALIKKVGDRKDHHINGEKIAREMLSKYKIDNAKLERICACVLNHRSSKNARTIEEICVCDADVIAHFDNIPMLFNSAYNRHNLGLVEAKEWIRNVFEDDYNDLSPKTQRLFKNRYDIICEVVLGRENR
jgi:uncharacterized protein